MKKIIIAVVYCVLLSISCDNRGEDRTRREAAEVYDAGTASIAKSYFLYHEIKNVDYEIYINDELAGQSHENNGVPGPYKLNQYMTSAGKQIVKMRIAANNNQKEITEEILREINKNAGIYLLLNKDFAHIRELKKLEFPQIDKPVLAYEFKWEFEAD